MKKNNAIRVGSSDPNRVAELKAAHQEFEKMLADGWKVTNTKKAKRPRIKREDKRTPKQVVISLGEVMAATMTISWESYQRYGKGMKIVMRIY
jgi:hypothetical protein